jgi:integrase
MTQAGRSANSHAARHAFADHLSGKAANTIRRKCSDIALFEAFLNETGIPAKDMFSNPESWRGVTWGLVKAFYNWQIRQGYAIGSCNGRLSTVRTYAGIAFQSGVIPQDEMLLISSVKGKSHKEAKHVNDERVKFAIPTRIGHKKAVPVSIPEEAAEKLKHQENTPKGRRNSLLMCLILDLGMRIGEIAPLTRKEFDLRAGVITFYREKVDLTQTHELTADTLTAAKAYFEKDAPQKGILWRRARKCKDELGAQMSERWAVRSLTKWVKEMGIKEGLEGLSGHDGRHYWATQEARSGTPINAMMDAGGWKSPAMPIRYVEHAHIANEGTASLKKGKVK